MIIHSSRQNANDANSYNSDDICPLTKWFERGKRREKRRKQLQPSLKTQAKQNSNIKIVSINFCSIVYGFHSFTRGSVVWRTKSERECARDREKKNICYFCVCTIKCGYFLISHPAKGCQRHILSVRLKFKQKRSHFTHSAENRQRKQNIAIYHEKREEKRRKRNENTNIMKNKTWKRRENWNCEMTKAELWKENSTTRQMDTIFAKKDFI